MNKKLVAGLCALLFSVGLFAQGLSIYCEDDKSLQTVGADGKLTGFSVEVVQEIQRRVGNKDSIQVVPWARGVNNLNMLSNTLLFSMARTAERNPLYQWVGPIFENVYGLYVKADSPLKITTLEDAKTVGVIGVYRDDARDQTLTKLGFTNLERTTDNVQNFKKLMAGRVDMAAGSALGVQALADSAGFKPAELKLAVAFLRPQLYIAASKSLDPSIVAGWNKALEDMKKDHTFQKILKKYFPDLEPPGPAITKF